MAEAAPNLSLAFQMPPERAIEYFASKGLRISRHARDMTAEGHARAFTVAGVLKAEALGDIRSELQRALDQGDTFETFVRRLKPRLQTRGWWGGTPLDPETGEILPGRAMTPRRLRTVFQTNLQSAYMAGRYKAQLENADRRPFWEYVAVLDSRTRPRHRALNGRVFRYDDPAWGAIYPPNGYNCRCRVRARSAEEFDADGLALSRGEGQMETAEVDLGPRGGKVAVTGYRDPGTKDLFLPDPGFDHNPGQGAYGLDIALARRVQALKTRELRTQVWEGLNNGPKRLAAYREWVERALDPRAVAADAQVVGFVGEDVADFMRVRVPDQEPARVAVLSRRGLLHADSARHAADGIALTRDQYTMLPGIVDKPDAVYFDTEHRNFVLTRRLADEGVVYVALTPDYRLKGAGRIDTIVNAYRLGAEAARRLDNRGRFVKMGG